MFELKSNSIGLASTKNSKLQIAQAMIAMMQICIFFAVVSLYCYGKLTRVELLTECSCYSSLLFTTYLISYFIETLFIALVDKLSVILKFGHSEKATKI